MSGVERQQVDDGEEESEGGNMEERVQEKWEERGGEICKSYLFNRFEGILPGSYRRQQSRDDTFE